MNFDKESKSVFFFFFFFLGGGGGGGGAGQGRGSGPPLLLQIFIKIFLHNHIIISDFILSNFS